VRDPSGLIEWGTASRLGRRPLCHLHPSAALPYLAVPGVAASPDGPDHSFGHVLSGRRTPLVDGCRSDLARPARRSRTGQYQWVGGTGARRLGRARPRRITSRRDPSSPCLP